MDQAMREYAKEHGKDKYHWLKNNCSSFVRQTIRAGARGSGGFSGRAGPN